MIKNLVFKGGGVRGIAYVGALDAANEAGYLNNVERVAGTSAGAIVALMLALAYSIEEIKVELSNLDFNKFQDSDSSLLSNFWQDLDSFSISKGYYSGNYCLTWLKGLVKRKTGNPDTSFEELHELRLNQLATKSDITFKDVYLIASNVSTQWREVLSYESTKRKGWSLALAARASMSIPGFFKPVVIGNEFFTDGGSVDNYALNLFDNIRYFNQEINDDNYNSETLGFRVDSTTMVNIVKKLQEPDVNEVDSLLSYSLAGLQLTINGPDIVFLSQSEPDPRTVYCDSMDIIAVNFDITNEQKQKLIDNGRLAFNEYRLRKSATNKVDSKDKSIINIINQEAPMPNTPTILNVFPNNKLSPKPRTNVCNKVTNYFKKSG